MAEFKNDKGESIYDNSRKRSIVKDGIVYKRIPRPKYKSRAERASEVAGAISSCIEKLRSIMDDLSDVEPITDAQRETAINEANNILNDLDITDAELLKDEMVSWKENLESGNMDHIPKYDEVSDCADTLENVDWEVPEISDIDSITDAIEKLEEMQQSLDDANFPGMY